MQVLQQEGHAFEGPTRNACRNRLSRLLEHRDDDRPKRPVARFGSRDGRLEQLFRRGFAAFHQLGQAECIVVLVVLHESSTVLLGEFPGARPEAERCRFSIVPIPGRCRDESPGLDPWDFIREHTGHLVLSAAVLPPGGFDELRAAA